MALSCLPLSSDYRWWSEETVAVVTGANRGIGLEIVRQLANFGIKVILTCRDCDRGRRAVEQLAAQHVKVAFHPLDICDQSSVNAFAGWLATAYGGLDILVNNAGVSFNETHENSVEHAETVINTNYYGSKSLTEALLRLFRSNSSGGGRILNVSSRLGLLNGRHNKLHNEGLRRELEDVENLSETAIDRFVQKFLQEVAYGTWKSGGWPRLWTDYSVSKIALNAYSRLLARRLSERPDEGYKVSVNCYCPGFTKTGMTKGKGIHTAEQAAENAVWIILLPPHLLPTGKFFQERQQLCFSKL